LSDNKITIEIAKKEDASALIEYVKKVADVTNFLTFDSSEFNKTIEEEERIIEAHDLAKNQLFIVAKLENKIIGMLNVQSINKRRLEHIGVLGMSVLKEFWKKGAGGSLLNYKVCWAKEGGVIKKLNLKVLLNNESAIRLYMKHGFIIEGRISKDIKLKDGFQETYQMGLLVN